MVRRGLKTTVIATVMAMMLAPSFSAFAQTGKSNTSGSWQVENNAWVFRNAEGQSVKGWVVYNQEWYYLNPENGQLKTGWLQLDGKWYFLSTESGAQQGRLLTGWQWIDGYCYYLMPTDDNNYGVLVVNGRTPDGYYVNQSGQWLHGENGDAVYEAGKGLPSAASSQQVAGASRALPGQVLGASRAIAAPGGGSFGGGGGGGSTGGGATASTTGGAGTATAGATTAGAATGTATGGSAAETTGTAGESATAGGATGASTGAEANANASTEAESNASVSTGEPAGNANPSTEGTETAPSTDNTAGTETGAENGGNAEENTGAETGGTTEETPNTQPGGTTEENSGNETGGTTVPGGEVGGSNTGTEAPSTGGEGSETAPSTDNTAGTETGTENGGNAEGNSGTETGGTTEENTGAETGGTSGENSGTENGGNAEENSGTETGGTTEENSGTETGGTTEEKPGTSGNTDTAVDPKKPTKPEESENTEEPKKPEEPKEEDKKGVDWPGECKLSYNQDKKCFVLTFAADSDSKEINDFLLKDIMVSVTTTTNSIEKTINYKMGDSFQNLMRAGNVFCYGYIGEEKNPRFLNALKISRAAFIEGENNKVTIQVEGYESKEFSLTVSKEELEDGLVGLKDLGKLESRIKDKVQAGSYRVKLVIFEKPSTEQLTVLKKLNTVTLDDVEYKKVEYPSPESSEPSTPSYADLCRIGPPSYISWEEGNDYYFAIANPPRESGNYTIVFQPEEYKDISLSYTQEKEKIKKVPELQGLNLSSNKQYYEVRFKGDRLSNIAYLKSIKKLTVGGKIYGQMKSFQPELLRNGEKYVLADTSGKQDLEDMLLFSLPTSSIEGKQEIQIESEGYEPNTIPLP